MPHTKIFIPILATIGAVVATGAAPAAVIVKKAPANLTNLQLQQKLTPLLSAMKQEQRDEIAQLNATAQSAFEKLAPEREALLKALNADPRYKSFLSQVEAQRKSGGSLKARSARFEALATANRAMFDDAVKTAKISSATLQSKLGGATLAPDLSVIIARRSLAGSASSKALSTGSLITLGPDEETFVPPFDFEETDAGTGGLTIQTSEPEVDLVNGVATTDSFLDGIAGGVSSDAQVGKTFTAPAGFKRMKVTVSYEMTYRNFAMSLGSVATSCSGYSLRVASLTNSSRVKEGVSDYHCSVAPIAWFASTRGSLTEEVVMNLRLPENDRDYVVVAQSDDNMLLTGPVVGGANSVVRSTIKSIRVKYLRD